MSEWWQYIEVEDYRDKVEDATFMLEGILKACEYNGIGTIKDVAKAEESLKIIEKFFDEVYYM